MSIWSKKSFTGVLSISILLIMNCSLLAAGQLDLAISAFEQKKYRDTVKHAGKTLATANQTPLVMAKALLIRGMAYRNQGKIAQAIADFSNAEWLRKLGKEDLRLLYNERALAYEAAGQKTLAARDRKVAGSSSLKGALSAKRKSTSTSLKPSNSTITTPQSSGDFFGGLGSLFGFNSTPKPKPQEKPVQAAKVETKKVVSTPLKTALKAETAKKQKQIATKKTDIKQNSAWEAQRREKKEKVTDVKAPTQIAPKKKNDNQVGDGVTKFFNSLFGGGQEKTPPQEQDVIAADQVIALAKENEKRQKLANEQKKLTKVKKAKPVKVATVRPLKKKVARTQQPAKRSLYHLQLGAFGEAAAADRFANRISKNFKSLIGNKVAMVVETDTGNNRRQYRVYLGPFRDRSKGLKSCKAFKKLGLACSLLE